MAERFALIAKARELYLGGRVRALSVDVLEVQGEHRRHVVDRLNGSWRCSCTAGHFRPDAPCSHALAAALAAEVAEQATLAQPAVAGTTR